MPEPKMTAAKSTELANDARWMTRFALRCMGDLPFILVVGLLVASVLVPARETWRIMRLLRETTEVIEPARILVARLEFGLTVESAALERYALSRDSTHRADYFAAQNDNRRLAAIEDLAHMLDTGVVERTRGIRNQITRWRAISHTIVDGHLSPATLPASLESEQTSYDAMLGDVTRLGAYLAVEGNTRRDLIRRSERLSLLVNAALVLIALAAVFAVAALRQRERLLTRILERRIREEAALREAAETLAAAYTIDDVNQQIARTALAATDAQGAFIEHIAAGAAGSETVLIVGAAAGSGGPPLGSEAPYSGSCTEVVIRSGEPLLIPDLSHAELRCTASERTDAACSAIVLPLGHGSVPVGALFMLSGAKTPFRMDDLARARTFGHLAALAYEKVRLLDEARDGRGQLERVMNSRSRLMRGFSHDVKNPLGAADGYAELLTAGVYGPLSDDQRESVTRLRRSIRSALDLIDDLHEMARAETGNVQVSLSLVDLAELVRGSGDEYRAAVEATGLSLSADAGDALLMIETDRVRVRQILSNLLSNAIKYTASGSVELRIRQRSAENGANENGWLLVDVRDTGRGVPRDKWDTIFEEFVRLGASEKSGAGLGLAVSQRLAHALGGRITVESEVGRGSIFTLHLPYQKTTGGTPGTAAIVSGDGRGDRVALLTDNA